MFKKELLKITGNGKKLKIEGWDQLDAKYKDELMRNLCINSIVVKLGVGVTGLDFPKIDDLSDEYSLILEKDRITSKAKMKGEASLNDLGWIRLNLCDCDGCSNKLNKLMEEKDNA